jgi:hypothetical protein
MIEEGRLVLKKRIIGQVMSRNNGYKMLIILLQIDLYLDSKLIIIKATNHLIEQSIKVYPQINHLL